GTITFNCASPSIVLNGTALPPITGNLTIDGGGKITISGNNSSRIFVVNGGATLTLDNLTLVKGFANADGGAIWSSGFLLITNCIFSNNQTSAAWSGGAIFAQGETHLINSQFFNNKAGNGGALMLFHGGAAATITGSTFHDNTTTNTTNGWGGAILLFDGASAN